MNLPQGLELEFRSDETSCVINIVEHHDGWLTDEEIDFLCNVSFKYVAPDNKEYILKQGNISLQD